MGDKDKSAAHVAAVAEVVRGDPVRMGHAQTLQRLFLARTNEKYLEQQLKKEREDADRLKADIARLERELKSSSARLRSPKEDGDALRCRVCWEEVEKVPGTMRPRYKFCRWCGARLRRS